MRVPVDATHDVQMAIQEIHDTLRDIKQRIANEQPSGAASRDVADLQTKVARMERAPLDIDSNDVFRGSGPAHAVGFVPDPGESANDEMSLTENGNWSLPLRGIIRPVTNAGVLGEKQYAGDILQVLGSLALIGNISAAKAYLKDLEVLGMVSGPLPVILSHKYPFLAGFGTTTSRPSSTFSLLPLTLANNGDMLVVHVLLRSTAATFHNIRLDINGTTGAMSGTSAWSLSGFWGEFTLVRESSTTLRCYGYGLNNTDVKHLQQLFTVSDLDTLTNTIKIWGESSGASNDIVLDTVTMTLYRITG